MAASFCRISIAAIRRSTERTPSRYSSNLRWSVSANERPESLKDVPTLAASGYPNVVSLAWNGLFASPGTPEAVISRINADVNEVLKDPAVKGALDTQGLTVVGGSASDFKRVIDGDVKRWGPVIEKLGVKLD